MVTFTIYHKTKISLSSPDSLRIQGPLKRSSTGLAHTISSIKERYRKGGGGNCKISWVLQSHVSSPQASRWSPVLVERLKVQTPESIKASDSRGMDVIYTCKTPSFISPSTQPQGSTYNSSKVLKCSSSPPSLSATAPHVFTMIVKEVKLMTLTKGVELHKYLDNWLIRAPSQEEEQANNLTVVDLRVLRVDNQPR